MKVSHKNSFDALRGAKEFFCVVKEDIVHLKLYNVS